MMGGDEERRWPPWLKPLLKEHFFVQCKFHGDSHKSECNMYCLDCVNGALCSLCLAFHKDHRAIQPRPGKGVTNTCQVCDRTLLDSFRFCSLACKIVGTSRNFQNKNKQSPEKNKGGSSASDSDEESLSLSSNSRKPPSFSPSTPPPTAFNYPTAKRRKGIPHRAPMGGFAVEI